MNFGEVLAALKEGKKVTRSVWGGYWVIIKEITGIEGKEVHYMKEMIVAVLRDNKGSAPAQPYQEDILAEDWLIIE